jgi:hypothetical protein
MLGGNRGGMTDEEAIHGVRHGCNRVRSGPASGRAVDGGFRGGYRVIGQFGGGCPGAESDRVQVRYVNERLRYLAHAGLVWSGRLGYVDGEQFPWQTTNDGPFRYELRYNLTTDAAVGYKYGLQGSMCRVRIHALG